MSEGRFPSRPAAPEDDWFVEPGDRSSVDPDEPRPKAEPSELGPAPGPRGDSERPEERRRRSVLLGAVAAVAALGAFGVGVLAAGAITGSGEADLTTTVTTVATTTVTTEASPSETPPTTETTPTTPAQLPVGVVLRPGDENDDVKAVQAALIELGYSTGGADGKFGPATERAVRDFQTASGLEADGVVGPATLAALASALDQS